MLKTYTVLLHYDASTNRPCVAICPWQAARLWKCSFRSSVRAETCYWYDIVNMYSSLLQKLKTFEGIWRDSGPMIELYSSNIQWLCISCHKKQTGCCFNAVSMLFQCKHLAVVIQGPIDVKGTSFEDSQHERMGWIMKLDVQQCWYCLGNPTPAESTEDWQKATTSQCRHWITISMSWIKAQKQAHTHTHLLWSWWDRPNPLIP